MQYVLVVLHVICISNHVKCNIYLLFNRANILLAFASKNSIVQTWINI